MSLNITDVELPGSESEPPIFFSKLWRRFIFPEP